MSEEFQVGDHLRLKEGFSPVSGRLWSDLIDLPAGTKVRVYGKSLAGNLRLATLHADEDPQGYPEGYHLTSSQFEAWERISTPAATPTS